MRRTKFTPLVVDQIPKLVGDGRSPSEIAGQIGCTVNSLRVRCSQLGLSLRRKKIELAVVLSPFAVDGLRQQAGAKKMSATEFAEALLEAIARDDLYRAVLDQD